MARTDATGRQWLNLVLGIGGLAGYLALVGGVLLWLRFRHAGLAPTPALAAVPPNQLVTTALIELASPVLLLVGVFGLFGMATLRAEERRVAEGLASSSDLPAAKVFDKFTRWIVLPLVVVWTALTFPFDPYGVVVWLSFLGPMLFGLLVGRLTPRNWTARRLMAVYVASLGVFVAAPVFARQLSDPLSIEAVRVTRPGEPVLYGGLVAVRDSSVALARCGKLVIVAFPADVQILDKPSGVTSARSLGDRLGIVSDAPIPRAQRLC